VAQGICVLSASAAGWVSAVAFTPTIVPFLIFFNQVDELCDGFSLFRRCFFSDLVWAVGGWGRFPSPTEWFREPYVPADNPP